MTNFKTYNYIYQKYKNTILFNKNNPAGSRQPARLIDKYNQ